MGLRVVVLVVVVVVVVDDVVDVVDVVCHLILFVFLLLHFLVFSPLSLLFVAVGCFLIRFPGSAMVASGYVVTMLYAYICISFNRPESDDIFNVTHL